MQLFYTIHSDDPNLIGKEETFLGPDNQSKMKRSVENAEHVGKQLLTINRNDRQLTLVDLGLFTPTAGQYFRDERRRRHSQYYGGLAQGSTLSATASSFEPLGQRFKGKNALVFYPEGGGAPSQDMDISHRIEGCDTPAPSIAELGNYITVQAWTMFRIDLPTLRITFLNTFPDTLGDFSSPTYWVTGRPKRAAPTNLRGSEARFSNTTNFGVTPEEARELHQSQKAYDGAKATAAPDGGGIWDGGASKDDPSNLI
ncbi:Uncharacterized protein LW94_9655 [Fusarium fujikuroi]|nr:Uncharacterized protein LW94_9655 [Fusarium fujikuroi]